VYFIFVSVTPDLGPVYLIFVTVTLDGGLDGIIDGAGMDVCLGLDFFGEAEKTKPGKNIKAKITIKKTILLLCIFISSSKPMI
jgi:hypothetical protein